MQTIELVGEKSVVKFDVEEPPRTAFILFQGRAYHADEPDRLLWKICDGMPPKQASITYVEDGKFVEAIEELAPQTLGPGISATTMDEFGKGPVSESPTPAQALETAVTELHAPELAANAEPDHAKTV